jgi:hypothetical protein
MKLPEMPRTYEWEYGNDEIRITVRVTLLHPEQEETAGPSMIQQPLWEGPLMPTVTA